MGYYTVKELHTGIYSIWEPADVFSYLLVGEKGALLFDTGFVPGPLVETIRDITPLPLTVVLSHGHLDHVNGAYLFDSAYIHPADEVLCLRHASRTSRRNIVENMELPEGFDREGFVNAGAGELVHLTVGQAFDLGGMTAEVVALEGHTAGSVGLLVRERRILLTGDGAGPHVWMFLNESLPMPGYIAMLERTQGLAFDSFYTGHSDVQRPQSEIGLYINVAKNAAPEKAEPYPQFPELGGMIYQEGEAAVVFNPARLA